MAKYVGKRIVPLPCGEWVQTREYEMLSVVLHTATGDSYMAKRQVPAGTAITDTTFWAKSSDYSQQFQNVSDQLTETLRAVRADNDETEAAIRQDNDATEQAILQSNTETRSHVDEVTSAALASLAEGRLEMNATKVALNTRIDSILGGETADTEVLDARVDIDNVTHENLGSHIRGITKDLKGSLTRLYGLTVGHYYPDFSWESGSIASPSNKDKTRIRTVGYRKSIGTIILAPDDGYRCAVKLYHITDDGYEEFYDSGWKRTTFMVPDSSEVYYRACLVYEDDSIEIPVSECIHVHIMEEMDAENNIGELKSRVSVLEESEKTFYEGLDRLSDLTDSVIGYEIPHIKWIQGSHTGFNNHVPYRIKNEGVMKAKGVLHVSVNPGYYGAVMLYEVDEDGRYSAVYNSSWVRGDFVVTDSPGMYYTVCLCTKTSETEEIDPSQGFNLTVTDVVNEDSFLNQLTAADEALSQKIDDVRESFGGLSGKDTNISLTVKAIAHRGDDLIAPQCTAPAYIMARKRGFIITENDLFISKDGQFVMWHDPNLNRLGYLRDINGYTMYTNGSDYYWYDGESVYIYSDGYVKTEIDVSTLSAVHGSSLSVTDLNFDVLRRIDFGYWFDPKYAGTPILTFEEWVLLCKQLGMDIYVDRKFTYTEEQAEELVGIVRKYGMLDHTSWITGVGLARTIRRYDPNARCGVLANPTESNIDAWGDLATTGRGVFFDGKSADLTAEAAQLSLDAGIDLGCYYVDFGRIPAETVYEEIRRLVSIGVTEITIDHYRVDDAYQYLLDRYD